jgi:pyruvate carboxylase
MVMQVTGSALDFKSAAEKLDRALIETRIRGVKTNIPFIRNVLVHPQAPHPSHTPPTPLTHPSHPPHTPLTHASRPCTPYPPLPTLPHPLTLHLAPPSQFATGEATTSFIGDSPELFDFAVVENRGQKLLNYLGELVVNGRSVQGASGPVTPRVAVMLPEVPHGAPPAGLKQVLEAGGPTAFAKAVRENQGLLLTDTTWRDAHQSLLATRVRTRDLLAIAPYSAHALHRCYSLENWGGATFDVALRFLRECPWERLVEMREAVPNVPFQVR